MAAEEPACPPQPAPPAAVLSCPPPVLIECARCAACPTPPTCPPPAACPACPPPAACPACPPPAVGNAAGCVPDARTPQLRPTEEDLRWLAAAVAALGVAPADLATLGRPRAGIFPKSRAGQIDLMQAEGKVQSADSERVQAGRGLAVAPELLAEVHHSQYGDPWVGGRETFAFMADAARLHPTARVLELGCGSLRVGIHFISFLQKAHYYCLEPDAMSVAAGLLYELPAHGIVSKRPNVVVDGSFNLALLNASAPFDLIFESLVFIHLTAEVRIVAMAALATVLHPKKGRVFLSKGEKLIEGWCTGWKCCSPARCPPIRRAGLAFVREWRLEYTTYNGELVLWEFRRARPRH
eukprot:SM000184S03762  [mRNA]  locus=s184:22349:24221:- [translate_table: standard]